MCPPYLWVSRPIPYRSNKSDTALHEGVGVRRFEHFYAASARLGHESAVDRRGVMEGQIDCGKYEFFFLGYAALRNGGTICGPLSEKLGMLR